MLLQKSFLLALLFSTFLTSSLHAQTHYVIDKASYLSKGKQQEIEVFLKEKNNISDYKIYLMIASEE